VLTNVGSVPSNIQLAFAAMQAAPGSPTQELGGTDGRRYRLQWDPFSKTLQVYLYA
jgi:hypothetical protein